MPTDMTIPNEIANQLGRAAFFMMGTKHKSGDERSLSFDVKCQGSAFNSIKITLNAMDTYDIDFYKIRAHKILRQERVEGIYNDGLHDCIERRTGLALRMPRIKGINC